MRSRALTVVALAMTAAAVLMSSSSHPQAATLRVENAGDKVWQLSLSGRLTRQDVCDVATALASAPARRRIVIDSPGGDALAGVRLGRIIAWSGAEVVVPAGGRAHSAAATAVMGGAKRILYGDVAFHAPYFIENGRPSSVLSSSPGGVISLGIKAEINMELEAFLADSGMPAGAIARVMKTGPNAFWRPGASVLSAYHGKLREDQRRLRKTAAACRRM